MKTTLTTAALLIAVTLSVCNFTGCGSSHATTDKMGMADHMGNGKMGMDKMGGDKMGMDKMGGEKMSAMNDKMEPTKMGDKMGADKMGDKMGADKMESK